MTNECLICLEAFEEGDRVVTEYVEEVTDVEGDGYCHFTIRDRISRVHRECYRRNQ